MLQPIMLPANAHTAPEEILRIIACSCKTDNPCSKGGCSCRREQMACSTFCLCMQYDIKCNNPLTSPEVEEAESIEEKDDEE